MRVLSSAAVVAALLAPSAHAKPANRRALAEAALHKMKTITPTLQARWRSGRQAPSLLLGLKVQTQGVSPEARGLDFVRRHGALIGAKAAELSVAKEHGLTALSDGRTVVRYAQHWNALPVVDQELVITLSAGGEVVAVNNGTTRIDQVAPTMITAEQARSAALGALLKNAGTSINLPSEVRKVVYAQGQQPTEGYEVTVIGAPGREHFMVRVDGDGNVFSMQNMVLR